MRVFWKFKQQGQLQRGRLGGQRLTKTTHGKFNILHPLDEQAFVGLTCICFVGTVPVVRVVSHGLVRRTARRKKQEISTTVVLVGVLFAIHVQRTEFLFPPSELRFLSVYAIDATMIWVISLLPPLR
jgi:hypothetical protein